MILRRPKPEQHWEPFFGCNIFPECRGTRQIDADGNWALTEKEELESKMEPMFPELDAAKPGDTIIIPPGTHTFNIEDDRPFTELDEEGPPLEEPPDEDQLLPF